MAPWNMIIRALLVMENAIVAQILRSPRFHHAVRGIHRRVEEYRFGRNPHEPLRPGEATQDPEVQKNSFLKYFIEELRSQIRGDGGSSSSSGPPKK